MGRNGAEKYVGQVVKEVVVRHGFKQGAKGFNLVVVTPREGKVFEFANHFHFSFCVWDLGTDRELEECLIESSRGAKVGKTTGLEESSNTDPRYSKSLTASKLSFLAMFFENIQTIGNLARMS